MKLKRFEAKGVYGYITFDIRFEDSLTFLTGPNGSGKSTALQLIESLLTPSIKELALTDFLTAELLIDDNGTEKRIKASKRDGHLEIAVDWLRNPLRLEDLTRDKVGLLSDDTRMSEEYFRNLSIHLSSNEVFRAISGITAPVFLGIERRHRSQRLEDNVSQHESHFASADVRRSVQSRRILRGNLAAGLSETQALVQEAYRRARRQLDSFQESLRNDVLLSAFHYADATRDESGRVTFADFVVRPDFDIDQTRSSIETALSDIGLSSSQVQGRIGPFFDKLRRLIVRSASPNDDDKDSFIELLMNKGQLDRLKALISLVQEHKKRTDTIVKKINAFTEAVNWFFVDSSKRVSLDSVGRLEIARADGHRIPLDALSSGERQLIIIFAHLYFNAYGARSKVFVIDEPELSLHLRWQEHLVEKAQESSPGMQLVLATHSPDIVGSHRDLCVEVS